jgi:hypothetical protein
MTNDTYHLNSPNVFRTKRSVIYQGGVLLGMLG